MSDTSLMVFLVFSTPFGVNSQIVLDLPPGYGFGAVLWPTWTIPFLLSLWRVPDIAPGLGWGG